MINDKYSTLRSRLVGFVLMIIFGWYFYNQIDQSNTFKKLGIFYILFIFFTIVFVMSSQALYDKGHKTIFLGVISEILLQISLYSLLLIPIIYFNKILLNLIFRIFPNYIHNAMFAYFVVLAFLIINRYFVKYYNIIAFKLWDSNPYLLAKSNEVVNKTMVQQFIYFGIAIILIVSQIDKELFSVFSKELNEIFIPATVTFIAIERALKSIKIE